MDDRVDAFGGDGEADVEIVAGPAAPVFYRLGNKSYPMKFSPRCFVCQCDYRLSIERALIAGYGYGVISARLPNPLRVLGQDVAINAEHISRHMKRHMPLPEMMKRQLQDEEMVAANIEVDGFMGHQGTTRVYLREVLRKGYEDLTGGNIVLEPRDVIAAAKLLESMEDKTDFDMDTARNAFSVLVGLVHEVFDALEDGVIDPNRRSCEGMLGRLIASSDELDILRKKFLGQTVPEAAAITVQHALGTGQ